MCGKAIVDVSVGAETFRGVAAYPLGFRRLCSDSGEDRCPNLKNAIHEGNGYVVRRVVWVCFVGFLYKFCGTNAPFLRRVVVCSH